MAASFQAPQDNMISSKKKPTLCLSFCDAYYNDLFKPQRCYLFCNCLSTIAPKRLTFLGFADFDTVQAFH